MSQIVHPGGVLVTDGNERAALAVARSLGKRGIPVYVGAETEQSLAGASRYCRRSFTYPSPWTSPVDYVSCLLDHARRWEATVLFPMTDLAVEAIGDQQERLGSQIALPIPSLAQYRALSNKYQLMTWARRESIPIPDTLFVPDGNIVSAMDQIATWPVVVKPGRSLIKSNGRWMKTAVQYAQDPNELRKLYHENQYLKEPSLLQSRVIGEGQGVFGLFAHGKPLVLFAHRRLRERPPSGGVSVLRESISLPQPMTDYAVRVAQSAGWHGVAMVEFKIDRQSQIPYLIEVNGRFWGSLQLAIDAGVDFPWLLYQLATTGGITGDLLPYRTGVRSRWWLGDVDHLLLRLWKPDSELNLPPGSPSRWKTLWKFLCVADPNTRSEVFRLSDPKPGVYELAAYSRPLARNIGASVSSRLRNLYMGLVRALWKAGLAVGIHRMVLKSRFPKQVERVLVLCKGNICRSPFAAWWLQARVSEQHVPLEIASAGLDTTPGKEAYPLATMMSRDYGIDLERHRTASVSAELVQKADVILVMELVHIRQLLARFPDAGRKTFLLGHFIQKQPVTDIQDPYGGTPEDFTRCYSFLSTACEGFLSHLKEVGMRV